MPPRYGVSPWIAQYPPARRPTFPRYRGETATDVAIVGAGLTGCVTAHACVAAGFSVVVLEATRVAVGRTAGGAGVMLPEPGPQFRDHVRTHGLRAGKRVFTVWRRAALDAAALLRRLNVRCGLEALDALHTAHADAEKTLRREYEARVDAGFALDWLTERHVRAATRASDACGMKQAGAFGLDPYRAALGLVSAARAKKAAFYEDSPVRRVKVQRDRVEITTDGGTLSARTVIVTTGAPGSVFAPLRRHFVTRDTYHVLTDVMPLAVRRQVGTPGATLVDAHDPPHRIRWTSDHRVLVAGAEQKEASMRAREGLVREWTFELMYELLRMYPAISGLQPAFGWRVASSVTRDGLPYIGAHRNYPHHLFALGGSAGDSLTGAFLAARILVRALQGKPDTADDDFGFTR